MPADRVILLRHGESTWNAEGRRQGQLDPPLSALGRSQAEAVASALAEEAAISEIVASDLARAWRTAEACAERLGVAPATDTRLREMDIGRWAGQLRGAVEAAEPERLARITAGEDLPRGGAERLADLHARVTAAVAERVEACPGGTLLIVSHGGPVRVQVASLLGCEGAAAQAIERPANAARTLLVRAGDGRWRLAYHNYPPPPAAKIP